jgi:hypothetical protein
MFFLMWIALMILAFVALLVLVVGCLLGLFLGGTIGGIRGNILAKEDDRKLATYQGVTWGGCLGALIGFALALILLLVAWGSLTSN